MSREPDSAEESRDQGEDAKPRRRHGWLMVACCIPMLAVAIALVVTGVVGIGLIVAAVGCVAMMALMMRGMSHGGGGNDGRR